MVIACLMMALFLTLAICLGIILIKCVIAQVSLVIFLSLLGTLFACFVLAFCEKEELED